MALNEAKVNGMDFEYGCYIDGHWGQYANERLISLVDEWLDTSFVKQSLEAIAKYGDDAFEVIVDIADEALTALNDATDKFGVWHWHEGELFLSDPVELEELYG